MLSKTRSERQQIIQFLGRSKSYRHLHDWRAWARKDQYYTPGKERTTLYMAGRGWGKTWVGSNATNDVAENHAGMCGSRILIAGRTAADVRDTMIEGPSGILATAKPWFRPEYIPSKNRLMYPNGVIAYCFSAEKPQKFRGPQYGFVWADELPHWQRTRESWDMIQFGLRHGKNPKAIITTTPLPTPLMREIRDEGDTRVVIGSTMDNMGNMAPRFFQDIYGRYQGTTLGAQELDGILTDEKTTALWSYSMIKRLELEECPRFFRVVVAIDPSGGGQNDGDDETGIAIAAIDSAANFYMLDDLSGKWTEDQWASIAIRAANDWSADTIVGEKNFGGNMVKSIIQMHRDFGGCSADCKVVTATQSKGARARLLSSIYEQGRGYHVSPPGCQETGTPRRFELLEHQMTTFEPNIPRERQPNSPDRMDAAVWAGLELLGDGTDVTPLMPASTRFTVEDQDLVSMIVDDSGDGDDFF